METGVCLRSEDIFYLSRDSLQQFDNVCLVSEDGQVLKVNAIMLASLSKMIRESLCDANQSFDQDVFTIKTEISKENLELVVNFVREGLLPAPMETIQSDNVFRSLFNSFGISLDELLFKKEIKTELLEEESVMVKLEDPSEITDNFSKAKSRSKRAKDEDFFSDFEDDEDYFPDFGWGETTATTTGSKSKLSKKVKVEPGTTPMNQKQESHLEYIAKMQEEFKDTIAFSVPEAKEVDMSQFEHFELSSPLSSYLKGPKRLPKPDDNIDTITKPFQCDICLRGFSSKMTLVDHENTYHSDHYQCTFCRRVFAPDKAEAFKIHLFKHEYLGKGGEHECINCGFRSPRIYVIRNHIKSMGPYHNNKCTLCPRTFSSHDEFKNHVAFDHGGKRLYQCGRCPETFKEYRDCSKHQSKVHGKYVSKIPGTICDICGKEMRCSARVLEAHMRRHREGPQAVKKPPQPTEFKCPTCEKLFKSKKSLDSHVENVHNKFPCDLCGVLICSKHKKAHYQNNHMENQDKSFKCEICGKGFAQRGNLQSHMYIHTNERPFGCKFCEKTFNNVGNQRMHIRTTHLGFKRGQRNKKKNQSQEQQQLQQQQEQQQQHQVLPQQQQSQVLISAPLQQLGLPQQPQQMVQQLLHPGQLVQEVQPHLQQQQQQPQQPHQLQTHQIQVQLAPLQHQ